MRQRHEPLGEHVRRKDLGGVIFDSCAHVMPLGSLTRTPICTGGRRALGERRRPWRAAAALVRLFARPPKEGKHVSRVDKLEDGDVFAFTLDARVVAIRWDLIAWALVIDLDVSESEAENALMHRAWLIFAGLGDLSWPFDDARVPNGCWITTPMLELESARGLRVFRFWALLPQFDDNDQPVLNPYAEITLSALSVHGLISHEATSPGEHSLSWSERMALATDTEFLDASKEFFSM